MKKLLYLFFIIGAFSMLTGCGSSTNNSSSNNSSQTYTLNDVSSHNKKSDCWMVINGKVYNVTDFINLHPGGSIIVEGCGKDATLLFNTKGGTDGGHTSRADTEMKNYYIGDLVK
jgi:cytochrome b involved in lipid metabolism